MNLMAVMSRFPTHESCIAHLETVRWRNKPKCPYCESDDVARKRENNLVGRWNCHSCKSSFNVLAKTMFQGTKVSLQKWFVAIALMMNAKKSLSSCQMGRDLDLNQGSAWYLMQKIRAEMGRKSSDLLQGIIEADETYIGGKPRRSNIREDNEPSKRGRGTSKTPILGMIERGGEVKAQVAPNLTSKDIIEFVTDSVDPDGSVLITDEFRAYRAIRPMIPHRVINHRERYVEDYIHTNTIEGFWSLLKRAWYGSHHHYRKNFTPLYVMEACYKYNNRFTKNVFHEFLEGCFA